jgi:hypothetical protein
LGRRERWGGWRIRKSRRAVARTMERRARWRWEEVEVRNFGAGERGEGGREEE